MSEIFRTAAQSKPLYDVSFADHLSVQVQPLTRRGQALILGSCRSRSFYVRHKMSSPQNLLHIHP